MDLAITQAVALMLSQTIHSERGDTPHYYELDIEIQSQPNKVVIVQLEALHIWGKSDHRFTTKSGPVPGSLVHSNRDTPLPKKRLPMLRRKKPLAR